MNLKRLLYPHAFYYDKRCQVIRELESTKVYEPSDHIIFTFKDTRIHLHPEDFRKNFVRPKLKQFAVRIKGYGNLWMVEEDNYIVLKTPQIQDGALLDGSWVFDPSNPLEAAELYALRKTFGFIIMPEALWNRFMESAEIKRLLEKR